VELWQAIILGLVEGITEYLPISSTGHLILVSSAMGLDTPEQKNALDAFNIVIQGGAILAVVGLYRNRMLQMFRGMVGRDDAGRALLINLGVAFIPAAVLGAILDDWLEAHLFFAGPVLAALFIGGLYMIGLDRWQKRPVTDGEVQRGGELDSLTPRRALAIGLFQCIAMWPGTSRSMMTITGGMIVGLRPVAAAEFSFLLGVPTLGAATFYKLYKNISYARTNGHQNLFEQLGVMPAVVGLIVAAASAALAVRWLVAFLNKHGLTAFGVYRIVLCAALLIMVAMGLVNISPKSSAGEPSPIRGYRIQKETIAQAVELLPPPKQPPFSSFTRASRTE
jgi:undecaprenyl-diphosphatase